MNVPIIYKGSDTIINIAVKAQDGTAFVISDLLDVIVSVYQTKEAIIQQWKVSDGTLIVIADDEGIVRANLDRDNLNNVRLKRLYLEVKATATNSEFENSEQVAIVSDIVLADLKNGIS